MVSCLPESGGRSPSGVLGGWLVLLSRRGSSNCFRLDSPVGGRIVVAVQAWIFLSVSFICTALGVVSGAIPPTTHERLKRASESVDRVVISRTWNEPGREATPFEIAGRDRVAEMLDLLVFLPEQGGFEMPCLCLGTHSIEFFRGEAFKFALTYHHWTRLRSDLGGPWLGDATIDPTAVDRFTEWFADQGFAEFKDDREATAQAIIESAARLQLVAEIFPSTLRDLLPTIDHNVAWGVAVRERIERFGAAYQDKADLIIAVWEAFALMGEWRYSILRLYGEPAAFLERATASATTDDFVRALNNARGRSRLGAMRHLVSVDEQHPLAQLPLATKIDLMESYVDQSPPEHHRDLVPMLFGWATADADRLLYRIAEKSSPRTTGDTIAEAPRPEFIAILHLARRYYHPVLPLIAEKRREDLSEPERTLLDVAALVFDSDAPILPAHFQAYREGRDAPEVVWSLLLERQGEPRDAALLAAAARSSNFNVQAEAERRLEALGLMLAPDRSRQVNPVVVSDLRKMISRGDYEEARRAFRAEPIDLPVQAATALFGLGRVAEADAILRSETSRNDQLARLLGLRGALFYALGEFSEAAELFTAAGQLETRQEYLVLRHLCLLHEEKDEGSPLHAWEPGYFSAPDHLPEILIRFLQGRKEEEELFRTANDPREAAEDRSLAHFVLAEVNKLHGEVVKERDYLEACLAVKAFDSLPHLLATRRREAIESRKHSEQTD
jgi:tetratricopeptide (TPR) repeat protein